MMPLVTTRIYDPQTSSIINNQADGLSFGAIAPASSSSIMVIDAVISGVGLAEGLGLGVVSTSSPDIVIPGSLYYAILSSLGSGVPVPSNLVTAISGKNGQIGVLGVGFRAPLISNYVALMFKASDRTLPCGCIILKWFFSFDKNGGTHVTSQ